MTDSIIKTPFFLRSAKGTFQKKYSLESQKPNLSVWTPKSKKRLIDYFERVNWVIYWREECLNQVWRNQVLNFFIKSVDSLYITYKTSKIFNDIIQTCLWTRSCANFMVLVLWISPWWWIENTQFPMESRIYIDVEP